MPHRVAAVRSPCACHIGRELPQLANVQIAVDLVLLEDFEKVLEGHLLAVRARRAPERVVTRACVAYQVPKGVKQRECDHLSAVTHIHCQL